ncbi:sigma-70 family RNA polymerase sigma factor [Streptodolium elevatio]
MTFRTAVPPVAAASTDSVADYLKRIGRTPLLDAEREVALARQIEAGLYAQDRLDTDHTLTAAARADLEWLAAAGRMAKQHMIEANLRLVVSVAKRYAATGVPLPDLIQEGNCGLIRAVEKFDHERGFKFSTYAMWWIKQAVQRAVDETSRTIRVPSHMAELIAKVDRTSRRLERDLGRPATAAEIGAELDLTAEKVTQVQGYDRRPVSLHMPIGSEGEGELGDLIEDTASAPVEDQVAMAGLRAELDRVLADLTQREAEVVTLRFGLAGDGEPKTFEEIGRRFGVTRERIRQIEVKAMAKLRMKSRASLLRDYLV